MIKKIIEFSAEHKYLVLFLYAALIAIGFIVLKHQPIDAIPDLSDTQVIVYSRWDRSPDIIEDQVTYPIVTALLGTPRIKAIRGFSDFGYSYVYAIFEDGTDIYWARSRVNEYLSKVTSSLPPGVRTEIGPDATGVGWVFQYALVDESGNIPIHEIRSFQDWNLRYALQAIPGVAEVATFGGYQKQYQIVLDRIKLQAYNIGVSEVAEAIRKSNNEVGARLIEFSEREYMVRSHGYAKNQKDLEDSVVKVDERGTPVRIKDIANVELAPDLRRGVSDLDGRGDVVSGIVVMRHNENADKVIGAVKTKLKELAPSFPTGLKAVTTYDRSSLIERAIATLKHELILQMIIVSLVILLFLWHLPSAIVPILTIPASVILVFIPMYLLGINSNIMSLAGIALSIGILVDGAIIEVENAYKKLELWIENGRKEDFHIVRLNALKEVGPSVFFSLLVIAISFIPIFALVDQEGRLFKPLAYTKNFAMFIAAILAITLDPAMRMFFTRMEPFVFKPRWLASSLTSLLVGKYYKEETHPVSKILFKLYDKPARFVLRHPKQTIFAAVLLVVLTIPVYFKLGKEFMPPLNEGSILFMPTTLPGISIAEAQKILQQQDRALKQFPEVLSVHGKAGRADSSTDPAPLSMMETVIVLKPQSEWRQKMRWYSGFAPDSLKSLLNPIWPEHISWEELISEMDQKLRLPGISNAWTMPIKARIDMLSTGVRTPIGIKIYGSDLKVIENIAADIEQKITTFPNTRSVFAERSAGGYFLDFTIKRDLIARYGLTVQDVQDVIATAIGGDSVSTMIAGRARYPINLRYPRELRDNIDDLKRVLVKSQSGAQIPLGQLADIDMVEGPSMIRNENGMLVGYVYVDPTTSDIGSYVEQAKELISNTITLPSGYSIAWSGQYENILRVKDRLLIVIPITLLLIFLTLYLNTKSVIKTLIVLLSVPFSLIGAIWLLYFLDYNISIASWVGMIALMGLDAEMGIFMLLFLDLSWSEAKRNGKLQTSQERIEAIVHGAVKRVRPKAMTISAALVGLLPMMWSAGTGADMMKRVVAPMVGGLTTSFILELLVYPCVYLLWKQRSRPQG